MPGINLFLQREGITDQRAQRCASLAAKLTGALPLLATKTTQPVSEALLVTSENPSYKVYVSQYGNWQVWLEMQGTAGIPAGFTDLLDELSVTQPFTADLKADWTKHLAQYPGNFLFLALDSERKLLVFANDALARLPVYFNRHQGGLDLGRDVTMITGMAEKITHDPLKMALFQMLTYVPGHGTPYSEVDTLKGGTLAVYNWDKDDLRLIDQPELRFAEIDRSGSPKSRLPELIDLFDAAVKSCVSDMPIVLSLSGGFDSRSVAASLLKQKLPFDAYTYLDADGAAGDEVVIAREIASVAGFPHQVLELGTSGISDYQTLLTLKGGLNYLVVAHFVRHLNIIRASHHGGMLLFTGDGGDKTLRDLNPDRPILTAREWLDYLYEFEAIFPPETCAQLFGIKKSDLDDHLLDHIAGYPTADYEEKYANFILTEQAARWSFEGEDRNRYFCRAEAPFYDYNFYRRARQLPNAWKKDYALYSNFLNALSPDLSRVRYANRGWSPARMKNPFYRLLVAKSRSLRRVVDKRKNQKARETSFATKDWMSRRVLEQFANNALRETMPGFALISTPQYLNKLTKTQLGTLYTVTSMLIGKA